MRDVASCFIVQFCFRAKYANNTLATFVLIGQP